MSNQTALYSHAGNPAVSPTLLMSSEAALEHLRRHVFPQVRRLLGKPEPE